MTIIQAVSIGGGTCVGVDFDAPFPREGGNCFDVEDDAGAYWRIVNFRKENLEELAKRGLTFPVKCAQIAEGLAVIHDSRIGDRWYTADFCEVCCRFDHLPIDQRMRLLRRQEREQLQPDCRIIRPTKPEFE